MSAAVLNEKCQRIDLVIRGDLSPEVLRNVTDETLDLVAEHEVFGVLVNLAALGKTPLASALQRLPEYYAARKADRRMRIAIVLPPRGDPRDLARFYKLSAQRRAYVVRVFDDTDSAAGWLREQTA